MCPDKLHARGDISIEIWVLSCAWNASDVLDPELVPPESNAAVKGGQGGIFCDWWEAIGQRPLC